MSIIAKKGSRSQINAAKIASGLIPGQVLYVTDEQKIDISLTTSTSFTVEATGAEVEVGDVVTTLRTMPSNYFLWDHTTGDVLLQASYPGLYGILGKLQDKDADGSYFDSTPPTNAVFLDTMRAHFTVNFASPDTDGKYRKKVYDIIAGDDGKLHVKLSFQATTGGGPT